jgi:DNA invertase Pin-like site-specific DNA recombinase
MKAIVYIRTEPGARRQEQREKTTAYVNDRGWDLVDEVAESVGSTVRAGELSSIEHREKLRALLKRAQRGDFDVLVVAAYDRLSADRIDAQLLRQSFRRHGVEVVSPTEKQPADGGELGVLIDRALGRTDPLERGKRQAARAGRHAAGRIPYGYVSAGQGVLEEHGEHANVVRRIFAAAIEGKSLGTIARELDAATIPSPQGGAGGWAPMTVSRILSNPAYKGERHGVRNAHPALVDRDTFSAAQRR